MSSTIERYGFPVAAAGTARVTSSHGDYYHLICDEAEGEIIARKKKSAFMAPDAPKPTTGDFVSFRYNAQGESMITGVLPRRSHFARRDPTAKRKEQILAVNFDTLFIMMSLNENFSLARIARYLALAEDVGDAQVFVVLTKADLVQDAAARAGEVEEKCGAAGRVLAVSAKSGAGMDEIRALAAPGKTLAFIGSSGVGKSTLLNALAGEEWMPTQEIQEWSGKGRHTTTSRELVMLPCGAMVIDTPGIREIGAVGERELEMAKGEATHRWRKKQG